MFEFMEGVADVLTFCVASAGSCAMCISLRTRPTDSWQLHGQWSAVACSQSLVLSAAASLCGHSPRIIHDASAFSQPWRDWLGWHSSIMLNITLNRRRNRRRILPVTSRSFRANVLITLYIVSRKSETPKHFAITIANLDWIVYHFNSQSDIY